MAARGQGGKGTGLVKGIFEWLFGTVGVIALVYVVGPLLGVQFIPAAQTTFTILNQIAGLAGANWLQVYSGNPPSTFPQFFIYWLTFTGFIYLLLWIFKMVIIGYRTQQVGRAG